MPQNPNLVSTVIDAIKAPIVGTFQGLVDSAQMIRSALNGQSGQGGFILLLLLTVAVLIGLKISGNLVV